MIFFYGSAEGHLKRTSFLANDLQEKGDETIFLFDDIKSINIINIKIDYRQLPFQNFDL